MKPSTTIRTANGKRLCALILIPAALLVALLPARPATAQAPIAAAVHSAAR